MNNSDFTTNQLREILPSLFKNNEGIFQSTDFQFESYSDNLIELNFDNNPFIFHIFQEGNFLIVWFRTTSYYDEIDSENYYFKTLQEISTVKKYINEL